MKRTATSEELCALLERVAVACGGDTRLDDAICAALSYTNSAHQFALDPTSEVWPGASPGSLNYRVEGGKDVHSVPSVALTYSLEATRELIGRIFNMHEAPSQTTVAMTWHSARGWHYEANIKRIDRVFTGSATTPPLACLAAFLKALITLETEAPKAHNESSGP